MNQEEKEALRRWLLEMREEQREWRKQLIVEELLVGEHKKTLLD